MSFLFKTADRALQYSNEELSDFMYLLQINVIYFQLVDNRFLVTHTRTDYAQAIFLGCSMLNEP
jgi:hypothetical protein